MSDKSHEFIIKIDGVNLSKEASLRIQNGINDILLQELAGRGSGTTTGDDGEYCGVYIPHRWIGRQVLVVDVNKPGDIIRKDLGLAFVAPVNALAR